jgi:hypothetical protein
MNVLEVSYDLRSPGRNYSQLYEALRSYHNWCHPLESLWVVVSPDNSKAVRDKLLSHLDRNDGLFVTTLTGEAAWYGLSDEVSRWLSENLTTAGRF